MNTAANKTAHKADCKMAFGRKDMTCPRCVELASGAAPRAGWSDNRRRADAMLIRDIRAHVCGPKCSPVCTFGDW